VKTARTRAPALVEQFADHLRRIVPAL